MTAYLLTRHPPPFPTESHMGYLLRLSGVNGFDRLHGIASRAGMKLDQFHSKNGIDRLAKITGRTTKQLRSMGVRWRGREAPFYQLLGQTVLAKDMRVGQTAVCPDCIGKCGFVEAHFDLAVMIACPTHRTPVVSRCARCSTLIAWNRPGLLECPCGASMTADRDLSIMPATRDLLEIVRRKVLHLSDGRDYTSGLPANQLQQMNLRSLLYLIETLGRRVLGEWKAPQAAAYERIVPAAAEVLSAWPNNFFHWLERLTAEFTGDGPVHLTKAPFRGLYHSLQYGVRPAADAGFLRDALSVFAINHGGSGNRNKRDRHASGEFKIHYASVREFAARSQIDHRTALRCIESNDLPRIKVKRGSSERILVDLRAFSPREKSPGMIYRAQAAAKLMGISKDLLLELRTRGHYVSDHIPFEMRGFHESDIQQFIARILSTSPHNDINERNCSRSYLRLDQITKGNFCTIEQKAHIVQRILSGGLLPLGCSDGTLGGILIAKDEIPGYQREVVRGKIRETILKPIGEVRAGERAKSSKEAALYLNCSQLTILRLLEHGQIEAILRGQVWCVSEGSLCEFKKTYVQIAPLAKQLRSSPCALMRFCEENDIPILAVGRGGNEGRQAFIRVEHRDKLLAVPSYCKSIKTMRRKMRLLALAV